MNPARRLAGLDGPLLGQVHPLDRDLTAIGSHPACDVVIPPTDAAIAARHAAVIRAETGWSVRDLDSPAGVLVNGIRISRERRLNPGDTIQLGPTGPRLRFEAAGGRSDPLVRRARRLRRLLGGLGVAGLAAGSYFAGRLVLGPDDVARQRAALLARVDSLAAVLETAEAREGALALRLAEATREADAARRSLAASGANRAALDSMAGVVDTLARRQTTLVRAASFDLPAVVAAGRASVALLLVERDDRSTVSGTAVAVRSAQDTSWLLTSRHLVVDSTGGVPRRLGVAFDGTAQLFEALLVRSDPDHDLALLRVVIRGGTPHLPGFAPPPAAGTPLAVLTFPLGLDLASSGDWRRTGVSASAFTATVVQADRDRVVLDSYGSPGMSGSPVLNGRGEVVGLVYGGAPDSGGRIVFAVPGDALAAMLATGSP